MYLDDPSNILEKLDLIINQLSAFKQLGAPIKNSTETATLVNSLFGSLLFQVNTSQKCPLNVWLK